MTAAGNNCLPGAKLADRVGLPRQSASEKIGVAELGNMIRQAGRRRC